VSEENFDEEFGRVFDELKTLRVRCERIEKELEDSERRNLLRTRGQEQCRCCIDYAGTGGQPPITENERKFHIASHGEQLPQHAPARSWEIVEEIVAEQV
jgi:hypothetical protein